MLQGGSSASKTEVLTLESVTEAEDAKGQIFRYWIQNFTNKEKTDSVNLANSQPVLVISRGEVSNVIYNSKNEGQGLTSGSIGTRWNVLEYDSGTRSVKWINTLVNISEGFVEKETEE